MIISWVVVLFAIAGLVIYLLAAPGSKAGRIGEIMFACGFLATCLLLAGRTVRLFAG